MPESNSSHTIPLNRFLTLRNVIRNAAVRFNLCLPSEIYDLMYIWHAAHREYLTLSQNNARVSGHLLDHDEFDKAVANSPQLPDLPDAQLFATLDYLYGRMAFDGLDMDGREHLSIGGTIQDICPIDVTREEQLTRKRIYINAKYPSKRPGNLGR